MDWNVALAYFTEGTCIFPFDLKSGITLLKFNRNTKLTPRRKQIFSFQLSLYCA